MRWAIAIMAVALAASAQNGTLTLSRQIEMPGVRGRIDHFSVDVQGRRLFVAALVNRSVEILDLEKGARTRSLEGVPEPQGLFLNPESEHLYVAGREDGAVHIIKPGSGEVVRTVSLAQDDADNIRYDDRRRHVLVGYGDGAIGVLSEKGDKLAEIPLGAHPESFQLERNGSRVFINVPDRKEVVVADLQSAKVITRWPVTQALKNYPMALDEARHRLFVGCREPARILVMDTETGKVTDSAEIAGDTDDIFYDSGRARLYVIAGQGFIDVLKVGAASLERIDRIRTAPGARTGLWVPEWSSLYVAAPKSGAGSARVLAYVAR